MCNLAWASPLPSQVRLSGTVITLAPKKAMKSGGQERTAGGKAWEVPTDPVGIQSDMEYLRRNQEQVQMYISSKNLPLKPKCKLTLESFHNKTLITAFFLGASKVKVQASDMLLVPVLSSVTDGDPISGCKAYEEVLKSKDAKHRFDVRKSLGISQETKRCKGLESSQSNHEIQLTVPDLSTLLPNRWLNSVVINAYLHWILECHPDKSKIYLNSAQDDMTTNPYELSMIGSCYDYILTALFENSHWTILFIDHKTKEIWHLNSDVNDSNAPRRQVRPYERALHDYQLRIIPCVKQCDNSSCGVYVCYWAWALLYRRKALLSITCPDILQFRTLVLHQILLAYCFR